MGSCSLGGGPPRGHGGAAASLSPSQSPSQPASPSPTRRSLSRGHSATSRPPAGVSGAGRGKPEAFPGAGGEPGSCQERGTWPGGFAAGGWEDRRLGWCLRGATAPGDLWEIHREYRPGTPLCLVHTSSFNHRLGIFQQLLEKPLSIAHCSLSPMGTPRTRREPQAKDSSGVLASLLEPEITQLWVRCCSPNSA